MGGNDELPDDVKRELKRAFENLLRSFTALSRRAPPREDSLRSAIREVPDKSRRRTAFTGQKPSITIESMDPAYFDRVMSDLIVALLKSRLSANAKGTKDQGLPLTGASGLVKAAGHRFATLEPAFDILPHIGMPHHSRRGHTRARLPDFENPTREQLTELRNCVKALAQASYIGRAEFKGLRPKLRLALKILEGTAELSDVEEMYPDLSTEYAAGHEQCRRNLPPPPTAWTSANWKKTCPTIHRDNLCILPGGHALPHSHGFGTDDAELVRNLLAQVRITSLADAQEWYYLYHANHWHARLSLEGRDTAPLLQVREWLDIALRFAWIPERPVSEGMAGLVRTARFIEQRGANPSSI